ncbi:hypothetical protein PVAP13_5NG169600 [Panicum virgatum]|uniref:Uncharacterized protein n=1 Tax=Panicum virgatum TaxID=38727 RepID=A0A8T0RND6_PANVG|nr:hypothetical protein PVAP13_5NG169600 [Panicum virgatum]
MHIRQVDAVYPSQCRWARARDTLAGHVVQRSSGRGRKRREARSRVHSVGWAEQFRCRSQARGATAPGGDRDPFPRAGFIPAQPHSLSLPSLPPPPSLSPPSLPLPRPRNLTSRDREAPHNPSGTRSYPDSSRRLGSGLRVGRQPPPSGARSGTPRRSAGGSSSATARSLDAGRADRGPTFA